MSNSIEQWVDDSRRILLDKYSSAPDHQLMVDAFTVWYYIEAKNLFLTSKFQQAFESIKLFIWEMLKGRSKIEANVSNIPAEKIDILFWPFQKNHLDVSKNIIINLGQSPYSLNILSVTNNKSISDSLLRTFTNSLNVEISKEEFLSYKDSSIAQNILQASRKIKPLFVQGKKIEFSQVIKKCFQNQFWVYDSTLIITQKIKHCKPKILYVGNDLTVAGRTACLFFRKLKTQTFSIMHGSIKASYWKHSIVDKFLLFGQNDFELMSKRGINKDKLIITGSPKVEFMLKNSNGQPIPVNGFSRMILVAFSGPGNSVSVKHHKAIIDALNKLAIEYKDILFVFKIHKKDKEYYYKKICLLKNCLAINYQDSRYNSNIYEWLKNSELLITTASAAALDAMICGVPVITIDLHNELRYVDFIKKGISLHASSEALLNIQLNKILAQRNSKEMNEYYKKAANYAKMSFHESQSGSVAKIQNILLNELSLTNQLNINHSE